ncbi:MAG: AI-2E family transporter [Sulfuriferula sp.]
MHELSNNPFARRIMLGLFLAGLGLGVYSVLSPFLAAMAWASILAYTTWPLFAWLRRSLGGRTNLAALLMTVLVALLLIMPLLGFAALLQGEFMQGVHQVTDRLLRGDLRLPGWVVQLPWVGGEAQDWVARANADPAAIKQQLQHFLAGFRGEMVGVLGGVGRNLIKFGFALLTLFFLYRDGERALGQLRKVLNDMIGVRIDGYFDAIGITTRAVLYGIVLTALAQGALAGLGYWVAGVASPLSMALLTASIALIPFGTPFVWGSLSIWLYMNGQHAQAIGLFLWGALVVSWVDNLIRPLVISGATRIPFVLVMFGVLGGVITFGLIGLFIGPLILAVALAVWREWLEDSRVETKTT